MICGSVREGSLTKSAMGVLVAELSSKKVLVDTIDPSGIKITSLGANFSEEIQKDLQKRVRAADAVILCTPEYNGCFSSVLMSLIENLGYPSVLQDKPIAMLGVASGTIGAIKALEHLRSVCSHLGAVVLPWPISIAEVHQQFNKQEECIDEKTASLIKSVAKGMLDFLEHWQR